jgi:hypothetical protein
MLILRRRKEEKFLYTHRNNSRYIKETVVTGKGNILSENIQQYLIKYSSMG